MSDHTCHEFTLQAEQVSENVVHVLLTHLHHFCKCILIHGSAYKGGVIPHCSDIDFQIYLTEEAFDDGGSLPIETVLALHSDLARVNPDPFSYVQIRAIRATDPTVRILPGTYKVLWGKLTNREATAEEIRLSAKEKLENLALPPFAVAERLLDHGDGKLERTVRLLCTDVWPAFYSFGVWVLNNPDFWSLPKTQALELLYTINKPVTEITQIFYDKCVEYYSQDKPTYKGLDLIKTGLDVLNAIALEYATVEEA